MPRADIPARHGPYTACVNRFNRWRCAGRWARIFAAISGAYNGGIQMMASSSIRLTPSAAQAYDGHAAPSLLEDLPRSCRLLAGRAYDSPRLDRRAGGEAVIASIPPRNRVIAHDGDRDEDRDCLDLLLNEINAFRAIATRHDTRDDNFLASILIASITFWLRSDQSVS